MADESVEDLKDALEIIQTYRDEADGRLNAVAARIEQEIAKRDSYTDVVRISLDEWWVQVESEDHPSSDSSSGRATPSSAWSSST
jgi:hypothetical protein